MAVKFLSDDWYEAERENQELRDSLRQAFWQSLGIKPVSNTKEIDLPPEARLQNLQMLIEKTLSGRENDESLKKIVTLASDLVANIAPGTIAGFGGVSGLDWAEFLPQARRTHFIHAERTTYEISRQED